MPGQDKTMSADKTDISFIKEIQLMMYGLGDTAQPLACTAELLEKIILKQLLSIIAKAKGVASTRNRDSIQPEDILFMMRKNTVGLKRLITYLGLKDEKQSLNKVVAENEKINEQLIHDKKRDDLSPATWKSSRKNYCLDHLRIMGVNEAELNYVEDMIKAERLQRADKISQHLTPLAYENYHKARQASFGATLENPKKFLQWLKEGGLTVVILPAVSEMLVYLAKETLSQVIDMVLTLREQALDKHSGEAPPISVKEVREVLRRCWTPQSFTLGILTRDIPSYSDSKLLAV